MGIRKFVLENSSTKRDFPISDGWMIEQKGANENLDATSTTYSSRAFCALPTKGVSQDRMIAIKKQIYTYTTKSLRVGYLFPAMHGEIRVHLARTLSRLRSPSKTRLRFDQGAVNKQVLVGQGDSPCVTTGCHKVKSFVPSAFLNKSAKPDALFLVTFSLNWAKSLAGLAAVANLLT